MADHEVADGTLLRLEAKDFHGLLNQGTKSVRPCKSISVPISVTHEFDEQGWRRERPAGVASKVEFQPDGWGGRGQGAIVPPPLGCKRGEVTPNGIGGLQRREGIRPWGGGQLPAFVDPPQASSEVHAGRVGAQRTFKARMAE